MRRSVEWALLDVTADAPVSVGDLVSVDAGGMPVWRVMGVAGATVQVVPADGAGGQRLAALGDFRWRGVPALAKAA